MRMKLASAAITAGLMLLAPGAAMALPVTYTLQFFDASSGLPSGPFGTVTVGDPVGNTIEVEIALSSPFEFVNTGGHDGTVFNTDLTVTSLVVNTGSGKTVPTTGWTANANGTFLDPPFATNGGNDPFNQSVICCGGQNGGSHAVSGPLYIDVTATGITQNDFIANALGYFFAVDILDSDTGKTGAVAAKGPDTSCQQENDCGVNNLLPEPLTLSLFGAGLVGLGALRRRKVVKG